MTWKLEGGGNIYNERSWDPELKLFKGMQRMQETREVSFEAEVIKPRRYSEKQKK